MDTLQRLDNILTSLRLMAWERAKGELYAMLQTYYGESSGFDSVKSQVDEFINKIDELQ